VPERAIFRVGRAVAVDRARVEVTPVPVEQVIVDHRREQVLGAGNV
jgi:hypothetical protein